MQKLGRYEIIDELGRGGCGVVYRASDPKIGRQVAIKTIITTSADDATTTSDLLVRLRREAQSAGALSHPNIVTVHELAEEGDITYIVMEHVTGQNLRQVMTAGRLPDVTVLTILKQAADALDYAHSQGVVHRDVKPANFLLTDRGVLKVTDFGIAKLLSGENTGVTQTGMMIGTTHYMAPEQIAMTGVDGRTDQFALGVMAYEMLTGQRPFQGDSFASIIHQVLSMDPPPVETYRETLGPAATTVLRRALAKKNDDRYPTCLDFIRDLEAAVLPGGGADALPTGSFPTGSGMYATPTQLTRTRAAASTSQSIPAVGTPDNPKSKRGLIWALAALATVAVALQAYRMMRTPTNQPETAVVTQAPQAAPAAPNPAPPPVAPAVQTEVPPVSRPAPVQSTRVTPPVPQPRNEEQRETPQQAPPPPVAVAEPARTEAAPAAPSVPDPELPAGGRYRGPPEGSVVWSGALSPRSTLVMAGPRASAGTITGRGLPVGIALAVEVSPADVRVVELPTPANVYRLVLANSGRSDVSAITIRWKERRE